MPAIHTRQHGGMTERTIIPTQSDFDRFAEISGDHNPIHVDPLFSRRTRFGGTVAHGMMLFAIAAAEVSRTTETVDHITAADLVFPHPTYAGRAHGLRLDLDDDVAEAHITTEQGDETAAIRLWLGSDPGPSAVADETATRLGPLTLGDSASIERTFSRADNEALGDLVDDPRLRRPDADLSPVLIGGLVSTLLGMHLPGRGTNWLKQRYRYARRLPADATVTAEVRVVRLRPEKHLVDLACRATSDGEPVMEGRSLVYVADLEAD